jgi:ferritin-like metal-binding protein YciE
MNNLKDFMVDQLRELYNAEIQFKTNFDKIASKVSNEELRHSFELRAKRTETQMAKLDKIFSLLGEKPEQQRTSRIMEGFAKEVQAFLDLNPTSEMLDAGMIAIAQKAEHYKIVLYGTLREYAHEMNNKEAEKLLQDILLEEKKDDKEFTEQARGGLNQRAKNKDGAQKRFATGGKLKSFIGKE